LKIIGIDPGINATGYGIIQDDDFVNAGTIRPQNLDGYNKFLEICRNIESLLLINKPDLVVLEKVFYKKNIASLIRASELRGAIILTLISNNIPICEYSPAQIKLTMTGNGRASKKQVQYFVEKIITRGRKKISNHAIDALAIAYTAFQKIHSMV